MELSRNSQGNSTAIHSNPQQSTGRPGLERGNTGYRKEDEGGERIYMRSLFPRSFSHLSTGSQSTHNLCTKDNHDQSCISLADAKRQGSSA